MATRRMRNGQAAENAAAAHLEALGWRVVARNARTPYGEVDIVAYDGATLVLVEVRSRSTTAMGTAEEALDARKQRRLLAACLGYLQSRPEPPPDWRIDFIAATRAPGGAWRLTHIPNAVDGTAGMDGWR